VAFCGRGFKNPLKKHIFVIFLSFPLLEDVDVSTNDTIPRDDDGSDERPGAIQPSNPAEFSGFLRLSLKMGICAIVSRLLSLPSGPRFRELPLSWNQYTICRQGCW
jgi:hypothetical protein